MRDQPHAAHRLHDDRGQSEQKVRSHRHPRREAALRRNRAAMSGEHEIGNANPGPEKNRRADDMQRFDKEIGVHDYPQYQWRSTQPPARRLKEADGAGASASPAGTPPPRE
jgi:hypothetical protein